MKNLKLNNKSYRNNYSNRYYSARSNYNTKG